VLTLFIGLLLACTVDLPDLKCMNGNSIYDGDSKSGNIDKDCFLGFLSGMVVLSFGLKMITAASMGD
jgi:hypothetical protein